MFKRNNNCPFEKTRHTFFIKIGVLIFVLIVVVGAIHWTSLSKELNYESLRKHAHIIWWIIALEVIGLIILRILFKPIRRLVKGVEEIAAGNLDHQFEECGPGEIKRISATLNTMTSQIRNMLDLKTQLLLDVSHELRSPLTRIKLALEMMEENSYKSSISNDLREMEWMLTEILETENLKNGKNVLKLEEVELCDLIQACLQKYQEENRQIHVKAKSGRIRVILDPQRICLVLQNLVENAIKYSKDAKTTIDIDIEENDELISIAVKDQGVGIEAKEQEKIFEPFYRIDKSRNKKTGGYGLGLSLCKQIVSAHGGTISIDSDIGLGTTVTIALPKTHEIP